MIERAGALRRGRAQLFDLAPQLLPACKVVAVSVDHVNLRLPATAAISAAAVTTIANIVIAATAASTVRCSSFASGDPELCVGEGLGQRVHGNSKLAAALQVASARRCGKVRRKSSLDVLPVHVHGPCGSIRPVHRGESKRIPQQRCHRVQLVHQAGAGEVCLVG